MNMVELMLFGTCFALFVGYVLVLIYGGNDDSRY